MKPSPTPPTPHDSVDSAACAGPDGDVARRVLNRMYPGRGRMLHVGGDVVGLAAFKADGWRVHCISPDAEAGACRDATARLRIAFHAVTLEEAAIPDAAFDVVILGIGLHGSGLLARANRILRPGGHCLIDRVMAPAQTWAESGFRIVAELGSSARTWAIPGMAMLRGRRRDDAMGGRVWLQKISPASAAAVGCAGEGPNWLCREVVGVVTARAVADGGPADIRRGHPWRLPRACGVASAADDRRSSPLHGTPCGAAMLPQQQKGGDPVSSFTAPHAAHAGSAPVDTGRI